VRKSIILARRARVLVAATVAILAVVTALLLPTAQAAPGKLKPLDLTGVCNGASLALAEAIDAKLQADGSTLRMIQTDKPKKGETGYVDGTVAYAYVRLAALLRKPVGQLTAADIQNNPVQVQQAINDALNYRRTTKMGDFTLTFTDDAGNKVYLWCLKANADHGGPDLALLYVPAGKTPADGVWIAGCVLAGGMNTYYVSLDTRTNNFTKFVWYNIGPDPNNANRYIRYVYTYDPVRNVLDITKEQGPLRNGQPGAPDRTEKERNPGAPPADFKDLKLNGVQISLLDGDSALPTRTVVLASADPANRTTLNLSNPPLTDAGPLTGIDAVIDPGETIVLAMPDTTVAVGSGGNPEWTLLTPNESTAVLQYTGVSPATITTGEVIPNVATLALAPPTTDPDPTVPTDPTNPPDPTSPPPSTQPGHTP
jgi:hypothetical protein